MQIDIAASVTVFCIGLPAFDPAVADRQQAGFPQCMIDEGNLVHILLIMIPQKHDRRALHLSGFLQCPYNLAQTLIVALKSFFCLLTLHAIEMSVRIHIRQMQQKQLRIVFVDRIQRACLNKIVQLRLCDPVSQLSEAFVQIQLIKQRTVRRIHQDLILPFACHHNLRHIVVHPAACRNRPQKPGRRHSLFLRFVIKRRAADPFAMIKPVRILPVGLDFCVVHNPVIFRHPPCHNGCMGRICQGRTHTVYMAAQRRLFKKTLKIRQGL